MFMERPAGCSWNRWPDAVEYAANWSVAAEWAIERLIRDRQ
ncbi:hypothetical protein LX76_04461 [Cereibacter changlensis]|uniref:Uncharacterized protein n=1 Tax=Cereibacter changlensis TaxID=402884 RepID=A0A2W7RAK2_9RHOB|nr:hypothetical protein [Cereibacter changlensis]PZX47615.1 hypothetical protein LX76_04461 [Cereibacter changlensis]